MDPSSIQVACALQQPKYVQNLGSAIRACACFDVNLLMWTGHRIKLEAADRLPRELRMKDYASVNVWNTERPFDIATKAGLTPVCVELIDDAESLDTFAHPERALYVFGPEDGDVSQVFRRLCHRFVRIPAAHCLNLAAAMNVVLYDRTAKGRGILPSPRCASLSVTSNLAEVKRG